eukprot:261461_1
MRRNRNRQIHGERAPKRRRILGEISVNSEENRENSGNNNGKLEKPKKKKDGVFVPKNVYANFLDSLECPICTLMMTAPIYQCTANHLICGSCKASLRNQRCPQCRQDLGNQRARFVESMIETFPYPCKYKDRGCSEILPPKERLEHENLCGSVDMNSKCPFPGGICGFSAKTFEEIIEHLRNLHGLLDLRFSDPRSKVLDIPDIGKSSTCLWVKQRRTFLVRTNRSAERISVQIQHIGAENIGECKLWIDCDGKTRQRVSENVKSITQKLDDNRLFIDLLLRPVYNFFRVMLDIEF